MAEDAAAGWRCWEGALKVMAGNVTPIRVPNVVLLSWKKEPVDLSRSEDEMEELVGEDGGGSISFLGSNILLYYLSLSEIFLDVRGETSCCNTGETDRWDLDLRYFEIIFVF
ncbi:hypothetical protein OIU77_008219, partial [Salix suchowensis]